jgi:hypothetical protein
VSKSTTTYAPYPNDQNLNLNWFIDGVYLGNIDYDLAALGLFGARSNHRIATYSEEWDGGSRQIEFSYEFDDQDRVVKIFEDVLGSDQDDCVYDIYY